MSIRRVPSICLKFSQEVEEYLEHVWKLSTERLRQLETENKSLKKQININNSNCNESTAKGNLINGREVKQNIDNLCDSLKLKSSLKQIIQKYVLFIQLFFRK